jgi:hypothetical protein
MLTSFDLLIKPRLDIFAYYLAFCFA